MCELGNTVINRIYEARIDEITIKKPHPSSPRYTLKGFKRGAHMQISLQRTCCCDTFREKCTEMNDICTLWEERSPFLCPPTV